MGYTRTSWVNSGAPAINATNLNKMELGIFNATDSGVIEVDAYTGTDEQKLTAAIAQAQSDTYTRTMRLSNRQWSFTTQRTMWPGFKLTGSGGPASVEQPHGSNNPYATLVNVAIGGNNPWLLVPTGDMLGSYIGNMAVRGNSSSGFIGSASGTAVMVAGVMENLGFDNFRYVMGKGNDGQKFLLRASFLQGFWNINNSTSIACTIGGSDNWLWTNGCLLDSGDSTLAGVPYHLWLDYMEKSVVGPMYITCKSQPAGIRITGNDSNGALVLTGLKVEGRNSGMYSYGSVVHVDGGRTTFRDCWFAFAYGNYSAVDTELAYRTGEGGAVTVTGGRVLFDGCWYARAATVPETTPWIYASGASTKVRIRNAETTNDGGSFTGLPRVQAAGGATLDYDNSVTVV